MTIHKDRKHNAKPTLIHEDKRKKEQNKRIRHLLNTFKDVSLKDVKKLVERN